jgi:hypothetical protein
VYRVNLPHPFSLPVLLYYFYYLVVLRQKWPHADSAHPIWVLLPYEHWETAVTKKSVVFVPLYTLYEVNMIDDPDEAEQDVLEIIDPDLVSYTYSTRGKDQLRNSGWRMHRLQ